MKKCAIEKIHISEFRRFTSIELEMRPFMVLIGANGVGKTSFLDAIEDLYRDSVNIPRYHMIDVSQNAPVRLPQKMNPTHTPGISGEYLLPFLYYLREKEPDCYETLIDTLVVAFPDFDSIEFTQDAEGRLIMIWHDKKLNKPLYMHELSDGMIRYLWLLSVLYNPNKSNITMIDEPEVSVHPQMLSLLVDVMRETSLSTQLIVATQSDSIVRFLHPNEVVVMDIDDDGNATATWADSMDLEHWLVDFDLDEIWRMGVIGGRA